MAFSPRSRSAGNPTRQRKIVLVGESNVGKSCLALRLAQDRYEEQGTTHGMRLWPATPEALGMAGTPATEKKEVAIWDLGGQEEYRLVHQLFLHDTTLALMLLDPTRGETAFGDIEEWNIRLQKQLGGQPTTKLLVGTKSDQWPPGTKDQGRVRQLVQACGMTGFFPTSAKCDGDPGIQELKLAIADKLDWSQLSYTSRPKLFQDIREAIDRRRKAGEVIVDYPALESEMRETDSTEFDPQAVNTVVSQLAGQGALVDARLANGARTLILQIGFVELYAGALIVMARNRGRETDRGVPALEITEVLSTQHFPGIPSDGRLSGIQERI